jgi:hypothetical protein
MTLESFDRVGAEYHVSFVPSPGETASDALLEWKCRMPKALRTWDADRGVWKLPVHADVESLLADIWPEARSLMLALKNQMSLF